MGTTQTPEKTREEVNEIAKLKYITSSRYEENMYIEARRLKRLGHSPVRVTGPDEDGDWHVHAGPKSAKAKARNKALREREARVEARYEREARKDALIDGGRRLKGHHAKFLKVKRARKNKVPDRAGLHLPF